MTAARPLLLSALLAAGCAGGREAPPVRAAPAAAAAAGREPLPALARSVLKKRMSRHGKDMQELYEAVLTVDRERAAELAERIVNEPRVARPGPPGDTANALFPDRFFVFQDQLHDRAALLVTAARAYDDEAFADSFARVAATCVSCHAIYASDLRRVEGIDPPRP